MASLIVLDVLEEGITLIGGEKFATGSYTLPFLYKFNQVLEQEEDEPVYMNSFKIDINAEIKTRCDDNLNKKVLAKTSFFDKRFLEMLFEAYEVLYEVYRVGLDFVFPPEQSQQ